ncbi:MAG: hypothetical protein M1320_02400 [Patescibacteria group bacterium]|nr:hypothetical protein [Patescibacteria group bacterium]
MKKIFYSQNLKRLATLSITTIIVIFLLFLFNPFGETGMTLILLGIVAIFSVISKSLYIQFAIHERDISKKEFNQQTVWMHKNYVPHITVGAFGLLCVLLSSLNPSLENRDWILYGGMVFIFLAILGTLTRNRIIQGASSGKYVDENFIFYKKIAFAIAAVLFFLPMILRFLFN